MNIQVCPRHFRSTRLYSRAFVSPRVSTRVPRTPSVSSPLRSFYLLSGQNIDATCKYIYNRLIKTSNTKRVYIVLLFATLQSEYPWCIVGVTMVSSFVCVAMLVHLELGSLILRYVVSFFVISLVCPALLIKMQHFKK